jgi:alpha-1,3-mannosyltransferase
VVSTHGGYFHTRWAWPVKHLYFQTATRWALHVAHRVICTSQKDYRLFSQILPPEKLTVIGNGVDPFYFTVQKDVQPGLLVSVGRVSENKHIDRLIDMVSEISTQRPDAHLVLVGPYDHRLRSKLDARARERKVSDRVLFVGPAALAKVAHYLSNADVFVTASSYEAFGIALLEAMATGTIVVANDIEAFREVVAHGKSGFLVDFSDTSRAARVVSDAMTLSPSDRRSVGAGATEVAQARSWDRVVRTLERVYADVCDGRPEVCPDRARNCGGSGGGPGEG